MTQANNLTGMRFGTLTATARVGSDTAGKAQWNCVCDCGKPYTARADNLIHGRTKRCAACRGASRRMAMVVAMMYDDGGNDADIWGSE